MSNSVVPVAAVTHAKQLVRNKKTFKRSDDQAPDQNGHHNDADPNSVHAVQVERTAHEATSMSDTTMSGDFSFAGALASAAADTASLAAESAQDGSGSSSDDGDGAGGTILLVGAVGLVGLGVAVLAGGGGGNRNDPPTVSAATATLTVDEDKAGTGTVTATDPDGDTLAYSVSTAAKSGAVTIGADGKYTYTPNANFNGTDSFVVTVKDPDGLTATQTVNVTVNAINDAPVYNPATATATTAEDVALTGTAAATDVDGGTLAYSATAKNGTVVVAADGKYTYTPTLDFNGTDTIVVTAKDAGGASATQTITVTVTAVNDGPRASADTKTTLTVLEDTPGTVVASFTDPEGGTVTTPVVIDGKGAQKGVVTFANNAFTYVPSANANGTDSFTYSVKDNTGVETLTTVNVTITPVNDAPTVANLIPNQSGKEDVAFSYVVPANTFADVDAATNGDTLTYSATLGSGAALPSWLSFNAGTRTFSGTSPDGAVLDIKVTATDSGGLAVSDNFTLNIAPSGISLDVGDPTSQAAAARVTVDGAAGATVFTENAALKTNVLITHFGKDDVIAVTGAGVAKYSFATSSDDVKDLRIVNNEDGNNNIILLDDVLTPTAQGGAFVSDYASALANIKLTLGASADYNFMTFA